MSERQIVVDCVVSQPFEENTYLVHEEGQKNCVIFDPGLEPEKIATAIDQKQLTPQAIVNTHGHSDHIAGNAFCKQHWPACPLIIGAGDASKLTDPVANLSAPFGLSIISPRADRTVQDGDTLSLAGLDFEVLETPGHSSGHVVFVLKSGTPWHVLGGDVLFQGSVGRTDFPDSNWDDLVHSVQQKLFQLPGETIIWPGHGPATTVADEIRTNPFVGQPAGYRP